MSRNRRKRQQIDNVSPPADRKATVKQEAEGSDVYTSGGLKWVVPKTDTKLIEDYSENALLAEPLKNCKDLIFTTYEDHPAPWVTIKDPDGNIDDELSRQGQQIAKVCDFYPAHILAYMDQELGGCSVWSPGWGTIDGVAGVCPIELRNLPWNSFRELPAGFVDVYNDIMPGIVIDPVTGKTRVFQTKDDRSRPVEIPDSDGPFPSIIIVRDPTTPKPSGKPGCLPIINLITNYNYADKAWNQKMNRIASPILMLQITSALTTKIEEYAKNVVQKWGKDTGFLLTKDMMPVDPHLVESTTAEERLAWLKKLVDGFYNPATFVQKDGNSIGGSDSGATSLVNKRTVSTLSQLESGLGEKALQIWLDVNGYVGYSAEVRYPRPETQDDTQTLAEITEANKNGQISRAEARQKYPNLDLPELTPEEEAKMDAEFTARKPAPIQFGGFGGQQSQEPDGNPPGSPIGNLQQRPLHTESTQAFRETEASLIAARKKFATEILDGLEKTYPMKEA